MKKSILLLVVALTLVLATGVSAQSDNQRGAATLTNSSGDDVAFARLTQIGAGPIELFVQVDDLPSGTYQVSLNSVGDCTGDFSSAGPAISTDSSAAFPNLTVDSSNFSFYTATATAYTVSGGTNAIFDDNGAAIVLWRNGDPVACGVFFWDGQFGFFGIDEFNSFALGLPDISGNGTATDAAFFEDAFIYDVGLGAACNLTRVYKLSPDGVLDLWPSNCSDDTTLSFPTEGNATFVFVDFESAADASAAVARFTQSASETTLSGAAEVPGPGDADGRGSATVTVDFNTREVCYTLSVSNIETATAAHIHRGTEDVAGPVVVPLAAPTTGSSSGCIAVSDPVLLNAIARNPELYYVNVHNTPFPSGAVRGQLS
ncbi:MAG: CHRD domain-containing protein [Burkholderiales bacterium]|nr:CHRD domain-containing protein [Anaerolineae bacterium]